MINDSEIYEIGYFMHRTFRKVGYKTETNSTNKKKYNIAQRSSRWKHVIHIFILNYVGDFYF